MPGTARLCRSQDLGNHSPDVEVSFDWSYEIQAPQGLRVLEMRDKMTTGEIISPASSICFFGGYFFFSGGHTDSHASGGHTWMELGCRSSTFKHTYRNMVSEAKYT